MDNFLEHLFAFTMGVAVLGSGMMRQTAVNAGKYRDVTLTTIVATVTGVFGTHYISEKRFWDYAIFSVGCYCVSMYLTYKSNNRLSSQARTRRAAGIMLIDAEKECLVVLDDAGRYSLPVSLLLPGESAEDGAARALLEETGRVADILDIAPFAQYEAEGRTLTRIYVGVLAGEHQSARIRPAKTCWVSLQELLENGKYVEFNTKLVAHVTGYLANQTKN
jgi:ADP-ribose pyrophosphatase YjhB (NUDIX family)